MEVWDASLALYSAHRVVSLLEQRSLDPVLSMVPLPELATVQHLEIGSSVSMSSLETEPRAAVVVYPLFALFFAAILALMYFNSGVSAIQIALTAPFIAVFTAWIANKAKKHFSASMTRP